MRKIVIQIVFDDNNGVCIHSFNVWILFGEFPQIHEDLFNAKSYTNHMLNQNICFITDTSYLEHTKKIIIIITENNGKIVCQLILVLMKHHTF